MQLQLVNQNGTAVRVTKEGNLSVFAITESESQHKLREGETFNANTGWVTLASANTSAVAYLENTGSEKLIVSSVIFGFKQSTGGAAGEPADIYMVRNPTGGTIVSTATAMEMSPTSKGRNKNFGSSNTLECNAYAGVEAATITGGEGNTALIAGFMSSRISVPEISFELQKGNSIAITIKPPTGNTSVDVYVAFAMFVSEDLF